MLKKIAIHIAKDFTDDLWNLIFRFYDFCHSGEMTFTEEDFASLEKSSVGIRYHEDVRPIDAIAIYGKVLDYDTLRKELRNNNEFFISVVYVKGDASLGNPNFICLLSWLSDSQLSYEKNDFSFGVDISGLNEEDKGRYIYTTGKRIHTFIDNLPYPRASKRNIYYIDSTKNGKISKHFPYSLSHDAPESSKSISLPIDQNSLKAYFSHHNEIIYNNQEQKMLRDSIGKLNVQVINTTNLLEEWLVNAYLDSVPIQKNDSVQPLFDSVKDNLSEYCNIIYELVQNIIFHTKEKTGWLFMRFYKKSDLQIDLQGKIPYFEDYSIEDRFLVFDLIDYGNIGIVNTFNEENRNKIKYSERESENSDSLSLKLIDFFNPEKILPDESIQLTLRHVAHLGIKSFVSSVVRNGGYFSIETNKNKKQKERLESLNGTIADSVDVFGSDGTIYQVVLPVKKRILPIPAPINRYKRIIHKEHQNDFLINSLIFKSTEITVDTIKNTIINDKNDQEKFICKHGKCVIDRIITADSPNISIDMSFFKDLTPNILFKLIAYIRLNIPEKKQPKTLIFYNIDDIILNRIEELTFDLTALISEKGQQVWSERFITVLLSKRLQIISLCGKNKDRFCYINKELRKLYSNALKEIPLDFNTLSETEKKELKKYVLHYGLETAIAKHVEDEVLTHSIEDTSTSDIGCVLNIPARLGEKIYIDEFCQADHLFLNGFYATKFALFIVKNIIEQIERFTEKKRIVLLGYHQYSRLLIECVSNYLTEYKESFPMINYYVEKKVIGYEDNSNVLGGNNEKDEKSNTRSNELIFDTVDLNTCKECEQPHQSAACDRNILITVVPIATTLTTFDKLISCFMKNNPSYHVDNEYDFCTILIRDSIQDDGLSCKNGLTQLEEEWGWTEINEIKRTVSVGERTIQYFCSKRIQWHRLIDKYTFPQYDFSKEKFIARTRNSSLNVSNLLGYPTMAIPPNKDNDNQITDYYEFTGRRLRDMKDYIHFGHLLSEGKHYRYYFDIPGYINESDKKIQSFYPNLEQHKKEWPQLYKWIRCYLEKPNKNDNNQNRAGGRLRDKEASVNVIVTTEPDKNPQLTSFINRYLFNDCAYVIFLDIHDRNIKYKHTIIRQLFDYNNASTINSRLINYYFIDQGLLTGNAYYTAKHQMSEILNNSDFKFNGVITIINRLSKHKYEEISNDIIIKDGIYSFNHVFIPPSILENTDCYLCALEDFYKKLKVNSVITDCRNIIELHKSKYAKKVYSKEEKNEVEDKERAFLRMQWQNRVFYELSDASIVEHKILWYYKILMRLLYSCQSTDDKISFIKAISSPPLSDYVRIRHFAFKIMLKELKKLFSKKEKNQQYLFNDLILLKVLLKHLALLGSNALVRAQVILQSWDLYQNIINNLHNEINDICNKLLTSIKEIEIKTHESEWIVTNDDFDNIRKSLNKIIHSNNLDKTIRHNVIDYMRRINKIAESNLKGQQEFYFDKNEYKENAIRTLRNNIKLLYEINDYIVPLEDSKNAPNNEIKKSKLKSRIKDKRNKLNQFPKQLLFYIKIATHDDPSKSLWLGEWLRRGTEMNHEEYNKDFNVSRTEMFNPLFNYESIGRDHFLLPHLFYDNTTIIRRTLDDFEKELKPLLKKCEDKDGLLCIKYITKPLWEQRGAIVEEFKNAVISNYYYSWFRLFYPSDNKKDSIMCDKTVDGISFIEKYSLVLYAKLLLRYYVKPSKSDTLDSFDKNADHLLEVFSKIMDAQSAFISIKPRGDDSIIHTLSTYYVNDKYYINPYSINYNENFYCSKLLVTPKHFSDNIAINLGRPFVMLKKLDNNGITYGEMFGGKYQRAAYLQLNLPVEQNNGIVNEETIGNVTFLFNENQRCINTGNDFIKEKQELGRLLLLLKPELDNYVKHVSDEKMFDVWTEKNKYYTYLNKINFKSGHKFKPLNYSFYRLSENEIEKVSGEFLTMSNTVISFIYSLLLEKSEDKKRVLFDKNNLNFSTSLCYISSIFDKRFQKLLEALNRSEWSDIWDGIINIGKFDVQISINPVIFRYFVVQCFKNAYTHSGSGKGELKVEFERNKLIILNKITKIPTNEDIINFNKKYNIETINMKIKKLEIKDYGLTLISLIKYCDSLGYKCIPMYDIKNKLFKVEVIY